METILIRFDGGCRPTNPGNKYGSFLVGRYRRGVPIEVYKETRFELGHGTNNEAEFEAFLRCLGWLEHDLANYNLKLFSIEAWSDSMILVNHITNFTPVLSRNERTAAMQKLANLCLQKLQRFSGFEVKWSPRALNVECFGH